MCVCREDLVRPAVAVDIDRWSPGLSQASPTGVPPSPQSQLACSADHISIYIWRSSYPHIIISAVAVDIDWWSPGLRPPFAGTHNLSSPAQLTTYMRIIIWRSSILILSKYDHHIIKSWSQASMVPTISTLMISWPHFHLASYLDAEHEPSWQKIEIDERLSFDNLLAGFMLNLFLLSISLHRKIWQVGKRDKCMSY